MRNYIWLVAAAAAVLAVSLSVGVATATAAKGGNSANAKLCQKGGLDEPGALRWHGV